MRWLEKKDVLAIHEAVVRQTGEAPEILSDHLLESALAKPHNLAAYENPNLYDLAASYAEGIARNHCFANGNKRTAFIAADVFLRENGIELLPEKGNEHTEAVESLAQGVVSRNEFAKHLEAFGHELERDDFEQRRAEADRKRAELFGQPEREDDQERERRERGHDRGR